jgi:hypothetical protein
MEKKIYYHFLSCEHAIDDLRQERIKISLINELNDPFEFLPNMRYKFEKRQIYHKIYREISKRYGLLCFSSKWQEPLLWGHYADKHRGIALGFEVLRDEILKVDYSSKLKRIELELKNNIDKNIELFLDLAKTKYKSWSYEDEFRILINIGDCIKDKNLLFVKFKERLKIKEIILGCKFDKRKFEEIKNLAKKLDTEIISTRQGWEDYKIHLDGSKNKE